MTAKTILGSSCGMLNLSTQSMSEQKCREYDTSRGVERLQAKCYTPKNLWVCCIFSSSQIQEEELDDRDEKCIFLGYSEESKAYKLYNPLTKKLVVSRDVIFDEENVKCVELER
jgi:hypothetical protein